MSVGHYIFLFFSLKGDLRSFFARVFLFFFASYCLLVWGSPPPFLPHEFHSMLTDFFFTAFFGKWK